MLSFGDVYYVYRAQLFSNPLKRGSRIAILEPPNSEPKKPTRPDTKPTLTCPLSTNSLNPTSPTQNFPKISSPSSLPAGAPRRPTPSPVSPSPRRQQASPACLLRAGSPRQLLAFFPAGNSASPRHHLLPRYASFPEQHQRITTPVPLPPTPPR
jgi:hypothetical protein